ncbi:MAG: hypothetical protein ACYCXB_07265 [Candidatus Humimicrobiaceae bacterium]
MQNNRSIYKISGILVLLVFMLGFILAGCTAQNKTAGETVTPKAETTAAAQTTAAETQSSEQLSEQPDKAKYDEYFTEFYIGKLPLDKDANPSNIPIKTAVFIVSEDKFCTVWTQKKDISSGSLSSAIYDTIAKKDFQPKTVFSMALSAGGHMGSESLGCPSGKYEYKVYIDNILVIAVPFEVRFGETTASQTEATTAAETQGTEQLSGKPDNAKYDEYFTEFYIGKLPRGQQIPKGHLDTPGMPIKTALFIAAEDEFCVMGTIKKDIPSGSFYVAAYDTIAKRDYISKTPLPISFKVGTFGWADDPINFPTGKFEYKIYIDDVLVAVVPFEVR